MAARLQDVFASIFLPRDSIYADIDDPTQDVPSSPAEQRSPILPETSATQYSSFPAPLSPLLPMSETDDPFAPSPSVHSPVSARSYRPLSPPRMSPIYSANRSSYPLGDSKSPFIEGNDSLFLQSNAPSTSRSPIRSPSSQPQRRKGALINSGIGSSSGIGNRSLMGLLGGTRYEPLGFEGLGVGANVVEEEDEDVESIALSAMRDNEDIRGRGRGRDHDITGEDEPRVNLPPPPSALSPSSSRSHSTHSVDEDDDDPPPDFTSRVPLMSSNRRRTHPKSTTLPPPSGGWAGPQLGGGPTGGILGSRKSTGMGAKERALWRWVNVEDLDAFLQEVYMYYVGKGIWAIGLSRLLNLLTVGWVIFFSTFLMGCIDYSVVRGSHHLSEVLVDKCVSRFSGFSLALFLSFTTFYLWRVVRFGLGVRKLWAMHEFFVELLEVPEACTDSNVFKRVGADYLATIQNDIQTVPWHVLVSQLSILRASHPSALSLARTSAAATVRLDAHDVANRIMREENYLIALFNKEVLDISIPLPTSLLRVAPSLGGYGKEMLTRTLEWNLSFCLTGFLFGVDGQVRKVFVNERNKKELTETLRRRFILMGLVNAVFAPFIVLYLLMYSFFRYFEEYHKNPSSIGSRQFTQLARWKFREFNELPHLFQQRINYAHPGSESYVSQFPKEKTALVSRFVAFLAGSVAAVLLLFSLIDPDAFLHFEITPGRNLLFYLTLFGVVLAVARGMVPDENKVVDPEELMRCIVEHTHYLPVEWQGRLHSADVHLAFGQLFQMKIALLFQELISVVVTPFVLWYTLPTCAGAIVDFFREFTVHVDGLGYVCSFAVFDFKRHGDTRFGAPVQVKEERWKSNEGKMEKSFLGFTAHNPTWVPREATQSLFLSKMTEATPPHTHAHLPSSQAHHNPRHPSYLHSSTGGNALLLHHRSVGYINRLGVTSPEGTSIPDNAISRIVDRASIYEQAFQRSTMASTAAPVASGSRVSPVVLGKRVGPGFGPPRVEPVIDEESALDGDSYIATTETRPFGNDLTEERMVEDNVEELGKLREGLTGLLGEVYESKKW